MCRTLKAVIAVALIFLMTPGNRCSGARYTSSVKKFQCQNQSRDIVIPGTPNITMGTTYCEDYIFDEKKMGKVVRLFVEDFSHQFDLKELDAGHDRVLGLQNQIHRWLPYEDGSGSLVMLDCHV